MTQQHHFVPNPSNRDWTEDFSHENGNYSNNCIECKQQFNGHKRRVICKKCATPNWVELAKRKPPEDTKDNKAWAGAWLEGEMVGYAKCMVEKVLPVVAPSEEVKLQEDYEDLAKTLHGRIRGTDQEYILCAANWYKNIPTKIDFQPINIDSGFVVCGRRHHNIFMTASILNDESTTERNIMCEQGFLTSKDRWVNRKEAGEIAFKAGQTKELRKILFSEDLY